MLNFLLTSVVWNTNYENNPENSDGPNFGAAEMRSDRKAVRERLEKEHTMNLLSGVAASDGYHKPGSSKDYYQADAPTLRPDGVTALNADDNGRKWIRSTDNTTYFYAHPTWIIYGKEFPLPGYNGVSLTEWASANTNKPKVAAGSRIEVNGTLYSIVTDTALTDEAGLTDGWCYIKFVVSGSGVTPTLTNTFGTWDTAKQGFYDGSGNRYSLFAMYRSGAITKIYTFKGLVSNNGISIQTPLQTDINAPAHIDYTSTYLAGEKEKTLVLRTAGNGTEQLSFAHGLGDVLTNRRIISVSHIYWGPTPSFYGEDSDYLYWYVQGPNIYLRFSAATPTSYTYQIVVKYI